MGIESWREVRRPADNERVGYLAPARDDASQLVPLSLLGTPLGPPMWPPAAAEMLVAHGLAVLIQRWWCRLPRPLPAAGCDVTKPASDWDWRPVAVVEVTRTSARIRPVDAGPTELTHTVTVPIPVQGRLVLDRPE